jgi:hypothetical protein
MAPMNNLDWETHGQYCFHGWNCHWWMKANHGIGDPLALMWTMLANGINFN